MMSIVDDLGQWSLKHVAKWSELQFTQSEFYVIAENALCDTSFLLLRIEYHAKYPNCDVRT